jgi:methyl-accepting chemotaxis protein
MAVRGVEQKFGAILLSMVVLLSIGALQTVWTLRGQRADARVINLAGLQRTLSQEMTKHAFAIMRGEAAEKQLAETAARFDRTLRGLGAGDAGLGLPGTRNPGILEHLEKAGREWDAFRPHVERIATLGSGYREGVGRLVSETAALLAAVDEAIVAYEASRSSTAPQLALLNRQRALVGQISQFALAAALDQATVDEVRGVVGRFDGNLAALTRGDPRLGIAPVRDRAATRAMATVQERRSALHGPLTELVDVLTILNLDLAYLRTHDAALLDSMDHTAALLEADAAGRVARLQSMQLAFLAVGLGLAAAGLWMARRLVVRPLQAVAAGLRALAQGDLRTRLAAGGRDEIGDMVRAFNAATEQLGGLIGHVRGEAATLASASEQIAAATEQLAAGSQSQARQSTEAAAAIEELANSVHLVYETSKKSEGVSARAQQSARRGAETVKATLSGMATIELAVTASAATMNGLGARSGEIGQIVEVIKEIATQTNLLALNAAIEAARAGEHGRGFEVVAEEIRKLAEKSAESTVKIGELVREIQGETGRASEAMMAVVREVEGGSRLANETGDALHDLLVAVEETAGMIQVVAAASREQATASDRVATSVGTISTVTKESAAGSEEIARTTQDLTRLADALNGRVGQFRM